MQLKGESLLSEAGTTPPLQENLALLLIVSHPLCIVLIYAEWLGEHLPRPLCRQWSHPTLDRPGISSRSHKWKKERLGHPRLS